MKQNEDEKITLTQIVELTGFIIRWPKLYEEDIKWMRNLASDKPEELQKCFDTITSELNTPYKTKFKIQELINGKLSQQVLAEPIQFTQKDVLDYIKLYGSMTATQKNWIKSLPTNQLQDFIIGVTDLQEEQPAIDLSGVIKDIYGE